MALVVVLGGLYSTKPTWKGYDLSGCIPKSFQEGYDLSGCTTKSSWEGYGLSG